MAERKLITAALPYANGPVHIGHLAGVYIPADVYARFQRRTGKEVAFICGSDEHGIPITIRAKKEGVTPQDIVDKYHLIIKKSFEDLGISFDEYSRTTSAKHYETASEFFLKMYENGKFTEEVSEQFYDEQAGEFLADRYIVGTCPKCSNNNAYGDQCEKCGSTLSPTELLNPKSMLSGNSPVLKPTKNWYLPLNEYEGFLNQWIIEGHQHDWKPNVYGQVKSWLNEGLKPRAMTRDLNWGVPVPLPDAEGKVLYVWFDAPIGYISFTKEWAEKNNKDWKDYWQSENSDLVHFIGKDNIVFHCIIFPSMMKAHGDYIMPNNVPAFEFLNLENDKISTSRNWAVWAHEYVADFPGQQDVLRYALLSSAPETKDNNFTWKEFQTKNNSELVGILGNFINRVAVLTHKYYNGRVPKGNTNATELEEINKAATEIKDYLEKFEFRNALSALMNLARFGNQYLQTEEPWKTIKTDEAKTANTLFIGTQIAIALAQLSEPFMPFSSEKLLNMFNTKLCNWSELENKKVLLAEGHQINEPSLLFSKIEDETIEAQIQKLEQTKINNKKTNPNAKPMKDEITFDDFTKIDLRTATILEAEKVEKADKLLKFKVDTGVDIRTVVSGIAESFTPEECVGKQVMILLNLAPRKIRGIESQGMLLLTTKPDGKLSFVTPDESVDNGVEIG
ncbi:methionine--tRNA ligase [Riemerella anatipestifer]|uniref:Methionine--tRNA ligase n=1 Tax=Riemerella anatipestifer (strain ATCC 11845 / DSM 15868 / JCM 9532 / NCTC 11014) TaxID=693978 RepID=E4T981_RIEAD|nr:methionine--tRNA ligase [Riemerella anatipestifer]ADQ81562.1 methionyl-tRNA synthetase [Riemerella anatipestifer ATCC 11845 = DSM 15868]ADZ12943.1 EMAP domain [Riemerella anatipestifer RA-GD]AFD55581.1 methionyl-tRNA synthetase [Riemerella anatipestifer ATCC 11845 = DSM 15868]AGC40533.1 Methionyl-tRNA synthetase [Riemerella anatipestifer RA-CH-2]AKP70685.1 methionyl-tRNA synthetase [Riemerella anatipestifer]